ncbi:putative transcription factor [Hibiscus syriacus]|uniref:Transcription factor n=1 Tax=Hibiscus syriacus TaxID=106335 RepID=A0A6A3ARX4_HIBSY|nr:putative transcription factor [Hibiscus syriacus]
MPADQHFSRLDTLQLKSQIERKIDRNNVGKYFDLLSRFLSLKIEKHVFDRLCIDTIRRENVLLHNHLLRSVIRNASLSKTAPARENKLEGSLSVKLETRFQRNILQSLCKDISQSPCKGRTLNLQDWKLRDRPSPLGPHGKNHSTACGDAPPKVQEQIVTELLSSSSRPPGSVEDGEVVNQAAGSPSIQSRSPVRAPLGISFNAKGIRRVPWNGLESASDTCYCRGVLPDSISLRKRLERELEGLNISVDCADVLNNSLDIFMKRLITPCLELAGSRSEEKLIEQGRNWSIASLNGMQCNMTNFPENKVGTFLHRC